MRKIAFICVHNSCRSQIAEALGKKYLSDYYEVYSAGTETKPEINQDAVRLMKQKYGINMEKDQYSKLLEDIPEADIYVSMGCNAACPVIPGKKTLNWGLDDPTGKSDAEFMNIISKIEENIIDLKAEAKFQEIKGIFEAKEDKENAVSMSKYMRNLFDFYGISSPERRKCYREFLKSEKKEKIIDWLFLDKCYEDNHREFQYLVYDYLTAMKPYVTYEDISKIKEYIVAKSWWDTIDFLCQIIGDIGLRDKRVKNLMLKWSESDNIWIKRTAIEHQLCLKENTDTELLEKIILNSLGSSEFFINKAIGWALREYSKTNPEWVREFIYKYGEKMAALSIREGSKYI